MSAGPALATRLFQGQPCVELTLPSGDRARVALFGISGLSGLSRAAGWVLLASMTVNVVDLLAPLPIGDQALFLAANMRGIAAAAVCVLGFGPVRGALRSRPAAPTRPPAQELREPSA